MTPTPDDETRKLMTDPRVYFAAERTLLAWIRTGLSMMGFGFVVARFGLFLREMAAAHLETATSSTGFSLWLGVALIGLGVAVNALAAFSHARYLRRFPPPPAFGFSRVPLGLIVAVLLALVGAATAGYLLTTAGKP